MATAFPQNEFTELVSYLRGSYTGPRFKLVTDCFTILEWGAEVVGTTAGPTGTGAARDAPPPPAAQILAVPVPHRGLSPEQAAGEMEQFAREQAAGSQQVQAQAATGAAGGGLFGGGKFLKLVMPIVIQILTGLLSGGATP